MTYNTAFYFYPELAKRLSFKSGDKVLDLGSGKQGYFTFLAARHVGDEGKVWALDKEDVAVSNIDSLSKLYNYGNVKAMKADIEQLSGLPFEQSSIDTILLVNVLAEIKRQNALLADVRNLLKQKGSLLIMDWADNSFPRAPKSLLGKDQVKQWLQDNYYLVTSEWNPGPYHYALLATKY
jgi:ubiquinone/menaquinone biosynthesis C-methylase UbiE